MKKKFSKILGVCLATALLLSLVVVAAPVMVAAPPDADVVLLAAGNRASATEHMSAYGSPVRYKHRWWFPESYRGLDLKTIVEGIRQRESWCKVARYFLSREFGQSIGSIDGYAYFPKDFTLAPVGREVMDEGPRC